MIFDKIMAFWTKTIFRLGFNMGQQVYVINSSQSFQAINLKLCTDVISILKMCM